MAATSQDRRSHRGLLCLDEPREFGQTALEVLRLPLEDGPVTISRAQGSVTFPAKVMLVGAMNPCPRGCYGDSPRACTCIQTAVGPYQNAYRVRWWTSRLLKLAWTIADVAGALKTEPMREPTEFLLRAAI